MEIIGKNIDRLATIEMRTGRNRGRGIITALYEYAVDSIGGRPLSLTAAERLIEDVKPGDCVILSTGMGALPPMPNGETDGPIGVASLARGVGFGLGAIPIIVTPARDMGPVCEAVKAAGLPILEYSEAVKTEISAAVVVPFTYTDEGEAKKQAAKLFDTYIPKAVIGVELMGPNKKGVKHFSNGKNFEEYDKSAAMEQIFFKAESEGILTIACFDNGNEMGSGTIEEKVREVLPYGDVCRCSCGAGIACAVKSDVPFPAATSNWGAYAITAMLSYLLKKPDILQDIDTERRMLEACIMAGSIDGDISRSVLSVDEINLEGNQSIITLMHIIIDNGLVGRSVNM